MFEIILILGAGALVGYYNLIPPKIKKYTSAIQLIALLFMIFMLGAKIGLDKKILNSIGEIGIKAFAFAIVSIIASIIAVRLIATPFIKMDKEEDKDEQ